jgi:hypothetical protein
MDENTEHIDYKAVVDQLQSENEQLREKIAHLNLSSPITDAIDSMVVVIKQSDPMRLYIWACILCLCVTAIVQVIEVFFK